MHNERAKWTVTTHDWARDADIEHIQLIQTDLTSFARSTWHLVLEVLAYAREEAESTGAGRVTLTLHADGSIEIADNGRGTDTRTDAIGRPVRKPVMATRDVRFFDNPHAPVLPDGYPRRGLSVVAASSEMLIHTNHRHDGAWTQRYEHGLPVSDLQTRPSDGTTGTTVTLTPSPDLPPLPILTTDLQADLDTLAPLTIELQDHRADGRATVDNGRAGMGALADGCAR